MSNVYHATSNSACWIELLPFLGPLSVALIAAFTAFFLYRFQKKVDRDELLHAEKRKLYRDFLAQTHRVATIERAEGWGENPDIMKHIELTEEISLVAEDEVTELAFDVGRAVVARLRSELDNSSDSEKTLVSSIISKQKMLVKEMRRELNK